MCVCVHVYVEVNVMCDVCVYVCFQEFQLASLTHTKITKGESVWRKSDVQTVFRKAEQAGFVVAQPEWGAGHREHDRNPDQCPNWTKYHVKLGCGSVIKTSFAM